MKLLNQESIQKGQNAEYLTRIKEGAKLENRINKLREKAALEQVQYGTYKEASLKELKQQVDAVFALLIEARQELENVRAETAELRKPLDAEWKKVVARSKELDARSQSLQSQMMAAETTIASIEAREHALEVEGSRVADLRAQAEGMLGRSADSLEASKRVLAEAETHASNLGILLAQRERSVTSREDAASNREKSNDTRSQALDARERELNAKETRLNDREQVTLRNITRKKR